MFRFSLVPFARSYSKLLKYPKQMHFYNELYSPMEFETDSEMHVQQDDFCLIMLIEIWADSVQCLLHRQKQHNGMTAKPQPKPLFPIGVRKLYRFSGVI